MLKSSGASINKVWQGAIHKWRPPSEECMAWQTRPMVCRSPTDRKNESVGLKSEWSWNTKKSQAYFSFLERTFPFPRSGLPKPRYARFWQLSDLGKWKVLSRNEKFAFDFSYSWTLTFQPYRTYTLIKMVISRGLNNWYQSVSKRMSKQPFVD